MKIASFFLSCLFFTGGVWAASVPPAEPATWKAGVASVVITPEKNTWMGGYAARRKPAEGTLQELHAKALALEDERGERLVIVTTDLLGILPSLRQAVEKRAAEAYRLSPAQLLLNASHTHSGPECRLDRVPPEHQAATREYFVFLENRLQDVIGAALRNLAPARLSWSHARAGFAMNRRRDYSLPAGHPNANKVPNPQGPVDHEVPTLRINGADGKLRAALFGYACHNTGMGDYLYCGDYAGCAQEYLQAHRPGFIALFLTGCGADQNPYPRRSGVVPGVSGWELTQQHGRALANAVEVALTANPRPVRGPLEALYETVPIEYAGHPGLHHPYPVQVVRFGSDLTLVALGSEVVVDYSLRLKRELAGPAAVWVAGYSNDYSGYIPSQRVLREGGYEATRAFLPDGSLSEAGWVDSVETRIVNKVHELHRRLTGTGVK